MIPINWKNSSIDDDSTTLNNRNITSSSINNNNIIDSIMDSITNSVTDINNSSTIGNNSIDDDSNKNDAFDSNTISNNDDADDTNVSNKKKKRSRNDINDNTSNQTSAAAILYDNINIDKIFTDPNTTIVFPRLFKLRSMQYKDGVNLTGLSPQKLGILNVKTIHHISKVVEARGDYYRVRVCRTCSKYFTLIELGSYSDLESALLVNDMYEIQQQKYDQLCLLDRIDNNDYLGKLTARRRGVSEEQSLFTLLQQRMDKFKEKNEKLKNSTEVTANLCQPVQYLKDDVVINKLTFKQILEQNSLDYFTP